MPSIASSDVSTPKAFAAEMSFSAISKPYNKKEPKYDNSILGKINPPVAFTARFTARPANLDHTRFPSDYTRPFLVCAFADGFSRNPGTGRRLFWRQYGRGNSGPLQSDQRDR